MVKYCCTLLIILIGVNVQAQDELDAKPPAPTEEVKPKDSNKPVIGVKESAAEAYNKLQKSNLPVLGGLSEERREEIIKSLMDSREMTVPDIFEKPDVKYEAEPPETVYKRVLTHIQALPQSTAYTTRYLSLYAIPPEERKSHIIMTSFVLNSLSWSHQISWPRVVPGSANGLLVFDIVDYARDEDDILRWLEAWEDMTDGDVYFLEPWVDRQDAISATELSNSVGCVLRADWFNFYATLDDDPQTEDQVEGFYSKFLGLPDTESELFKLLDVRLNELADKGSDRSGIVVVSGQDSNSPKVARNNRKVNRYPTTVTPYGGYFYFTQDVINSRGKRQFINDPLSTFKDGGEYIWRLPNGLQGYFLTQRVEKEGNVIFQRVDEVPIEIAVDSNFEHGRVKISSCAVCHPKGINTFKDSWYDLIAARPPGGVVKPVADKVNDLIRLNQLYYADKEAYIAADQMNYQQSLYAATGLKSEEFVKLYKDCLDFYDSPVTPVRAEWEFGVGGDGMAIEEYLADKVVSTTQGSLLLLVKGGSIQRDSFEDEYKNGKLLQEIKQNIIPKGQGNKIDIVVPAAVAGTAQGANINIKERPADSGDIITLQADTQFLKSGEKESDVIIPKGTKLNINKRQDGFLGVEFNGEDGWIKDDS
jgi:hypothetical protein